MYTVNLMVGDWSDDGHGKTQVIAVKSSLPSKELEKAYKKGVKVVGIDVSQDLCGDYEDGAIPEEIYQQYVALDSRLETVDPYLSLPRVDMRVISCETFAALYMITCAQGHPELQWEFTDSDVINIGGYGLFV